MPLSAKDRFTALQSGEIDVLIRNTTWTMSRDTQGMNFPGVNYYDGQGFMVKKSLGIKSALELSRRHGLHAAGHHDRAQPRRLLPRQQPALPGRDLRDLGRDAPGL